MIYVTVLVLVILFISLFFILRNKKKNNLNSVSRKQEHLIFLNEQFKMTRKPSTEQKMNKEEMKRIHKEIEELLEAVLNHEIQDDILDSKVEELKISLEDIKEKTKKEYDKKEELIKDINYEVDRFKSFLSTNVFYPKEFVFIANRLQGNIIDLNEAKPEKLPSLIKEVNSNLYDFKKGLKDFFRLHTKLRAFIKNTPELTGNDKQQIYFLLQNGKLEEAESIMDTLAGKENTSLSLSKEEMEN
ncbi:hypothetical protein U8V72_10710 [Priestia filamentosa]|uniref:hypothetical protein n=1 Tax=Priestia filamentosa TaxID=1402861 RepID=UPI00397C2394